MELDAKIPLKISNRNKNTLLAEGKLQMFTTRKLCKMIFKA